MVKKTYEIGKHAKLDTNIRLGYAPERLAKFKLLLIGDNARIRSGSVLYGGTRIGNGLVTGHNVVIREENVIGNNFSLWSNSVVDYGCEIGDNVKLHCNIYIAQFTIIEDNVFMAPGVTIANDIHPECEFSRKCMKGPVIEKNAKIGVNVTILPFVRIGAHSLIGSGAVVTKDIPPYSVAYGNPARVVKKITDLKCLFDFTDKPYNF
jgi:acetyltransferase-like isoleucine patch superfamily enzyme